MNHKIVKNLLLAVPISILLASCGGTPDRGVPAGPNETPYTVTEDYNLGVISYTVQPGDRLGSIAQEFTGRSSNWRKIAEFNSISNPRNLQAGMILDIPADLVPNSKSNRATANANQTPGAQTSALAVRSGNVVDAPVLVTPINTNRDFQLNPIDPNAAPTTPNYASTGTQVKVIGSYYPKGIYTEPAAYSKLIMRVSPGTVFVLDSQINDWYKIEMESGVGYIRTSDAAIVE